MHKENQAEGTLKKVTGGTHRLLSPQPKRVSPRSNSNFPVIVLPC